MGVRLLCFKKKNEAMATRGSYLGSPDNPATAAVVAYITLIGWLIAYLALYRSRPTSLAGFHLRQALLIHIIAFLLNAIMVWPGMWGGRIIILILGLGLAILAIIGIVDAVNGRERPVPLIGAAAQSLFRNI